MLDYSSDTVTPFPQHSELYFPVEECATSWHTPNGGAIRITKQKALVRIDDDHDTWLATVGDNYKVVHNSELFPYVEEHMINTIDPKYMTNVTVNEHIAYGGRDCYREYIFNDLKCIGFAGGDIAFRLIVGNSYGAKAVTLLSGAIDFWCSNGMIIGSNQKHARKHTSGVTLSGIADWIDVAVAQFASHGVRINTYDSVAIDLTKEDGLFKYLCSKNLLSERHSTVIKSSMHEEHMSRAPSKYSPSMWHLYSALTDWATHSDIRQTDNDHEANTRIQRTQHAERVIMAASNYMETV